jgi:hypothetical protein
MGLNKVVDFSTAKLLKEKGFDEPCSHYYINDFQNFKHDGKLYKTSLPNDWDNNNILQFVKRTNQPHLCNTPTISESIMWLYEKHGIWIVAWRNLNSKYKFYFEIDSPDKHIDDLSLGLFDSPGDAYESAIKYTLENLL